MREVSVAELWQPDASDESAAVGGVVTCDFLSSQ